ncbi:TPA: hypothetical protein ACU21B_002091 [Mannheimia haemolytica]
MAQKLLKHELIERFLLLKEKQDKLLEQMEGLTQEINELVQPFMPKESRVSPLITMPLIAQVLRENDWLACDEIAEKALALLGQPQFVEVKSKHYNSTKRILLRLWKKGLVERCYCHWRLKQVRLSE